MAAPLPAFFRNTFLQTGLIFGFALLLYANTLGHGFALDDTIVITQNSQVRKGLQGVPGLLSKDMFYGYFQAENKETALSGGRYRPLSLVLFAVLYEVAGETPFVFHLAAVLLFALCCAVLYRMLLRLLSPRLGQDAALILSWLAALLFTAHPIHTEVVANVKSCDETLALLFSLLSLSLALRASDTRRYGWALAAGAAFFLACLAKENAVAYALLIPLALWAFRTSEKGLVKALRFSVPVWFGFAAFFLLRGLILGWTFSGHSTDLMNNPFLKPEGDHWIPFTFAEQAATIFYTLLRYLQLLVFPHPLTHDYFPRMIGTMGFGDVAVLASVVLHGGLLGYAVTGLGRPDPVRFGILAYLLPLSIVSNFIFPTGTNMAERFAFMPSLGFCLVVATLLVRLSKWIQLPLVLGIAGIIAALFSVKTLLRNPVWASNEKLLLTDVVVSEHSAKAQSASGYVLLEKSATVSSVEEKQGLVREALRHLDRALEIYPYLREARLMRGRAHLELGDYAEAIADYRLFYPPLNAQAQNAFGTDLLKHALQVADPKARQLLLEEAKVPLDRAIALDPNYLDSYLAKGACAYYLGDFEGAVAAYRSAYQLSPLEEKAKTGLAWSLRDSGRFQLEQKKDRAAARPLLAEALQLLPQDTATQRLMRKVEGK